MSMQTNIIIAGVGGQGTVLASKLVARAAMDAGLRVRTSETIGMAQRGGSVVSHVRVSDAPIASPLMAPGMADVLIGFEPGEAVRSLAFLRPGGTVVTNAQPVAPVAISPASAAYSGQAMLERLDGCGARLAVIDGASICAEIGSLKVLNVALLGAAAGLGALGFSLDQFETAIRESVRERFVDMNIRALHAGARSASA
ncbi:indolepyruvate oxidoreductase subunit beta [Imhoffiella purpurea]|uniref:Indolepyruvate oxidoreductase subunit IorB n=1 Tax=Imhoffiella purpurea TaxID=1249627 RepID=W9W0P1_9GAMM|nr:indolepyruvate oxidoreductase subunit beta [Imhoffiella purpurea]EXJ16180.1 Indolepyruvate oxidoreductase subunit IorB [Imhoffiella purpurea]